MKTQYVLDTLDDKDIEALGADLSKENEYITETAGFVPLEVKLKQFEQNGLLAQFQSKDFTSHDYREMYLIPDFDITPEDDLEEAQEKLKGLRAYQESYKKALSKGRNEPPTAAKAGTVEPKKETQQEKAE